MAAEALHATLRTVLPCALCAWVVACSDDAAGPSDDSDPRRIEVQVHTLDGIPPSGLEVELRLGSEVYPGTGEEFGFAVEVGEVPADAASERFAFLTITPAPGAGLVPAWVALRPSDVVATVHVVLLPRTWTIREGEHAGTAVEIRPARAADSRVIPSFWGFHFPYASATEESPETIVDSTVWVAVSRTWHYRALPVPLVLDHEATSDPLTPADSAGLWDAVGALEAAFGRDLFHPATLDDVEVTTFNGLRTGSRAVLARYDTSLLPRATGQATSPGPPLWTRAQETPWSGGPVRQVSLGSVDVVGGVLILRDPGSLGDPALVMHELLHTLGLGHGCRWPSLMALTRCDLERGAPTAADVAHFEVLEATRELERVVGTPWGLMAAVFGDRVLGEGLPPVPDPAEHEGQLD